jgi:hypothetical protein
MRLHLSALALTALALSGCKSIDVVEGRLPAEALELAQKFTGTYSGSLRLEDSDGPSRNLGDIQATLTLENGDRPVLSFNVDTLGDTRCASQVGALGSLVVNDKETQIQGAFAFDPANCRNRVEGRRMSFTISLKKNGEMRMTTRVLKEAYFEHPGLPPRGGVEERIEYVARMVR